MPGVLRFRMCTRKMRDPRRRLLASYACVIQAFTTLASVWTFFVFENVPGLTQKRHRRRYHGFQETMQKGRVQCSGESRQRWEVWDPAESQKES